MNDFNRNPDPDMELDALFALARTQRPDTAAAEYAFETRLMARLREQRHPDPASLWASISWKLAPIFAACVIGLAVWHDHLANEVQSAEQLVYVENPNTFTAETAAVDL